MDKLRIFPHARDMANFLKSEFMDLLELLIVKGSSLRNKHLDVFRLHNE